MKREISQTGSERSTQITGERFTDGFRVLDLPPTIYRPSVDFKAHNNGTIQSKAGNVNLLHVSALTGGLIMDAKQIGRAHV
jgi:hypothetical protein